MREVWLRGNTRPLWLATLLASILGLVAVALSAYAWQREWLVVVGLASLVGLAVAWVVLWLWRRHRTRLAYDRGQLQVMLSARAEHLPVEEVECFLVGQSPAHLPVNSYRHTETKTLVVRLRDKHADWERRELDPRLGAWCGHHITIRGTCCEPITLELVQRMNDRLVEVQRRLRSAP